LVVGESRELQGGKAKTYRQMGKNYESELSTVYSG